MELNDLIMLGACAILGQREGTSIIRSCDFKFAVEAAKRVWREVQKQEQEDRYPGQPTVPLEDLKRTKKPKQ